MADRLLEYVADGKGFLIITNYPKVLIGKMVSLQWQNYWYHKNRLPSQDNPKYNFRKIFWADRHFNL